MLDWSNLHLISTTQSSTTVENLQCDVMPSGCWSQSLQMLIQSWCQLYKTASGRGMLVLESANGQQKPLGFGRWRVAWQYNIKIIKWGGASGDCPVHELQQQARGQPWAMGFPNQLLHYSNRWSGIYQATSEMVHGRQDYTQWSETQGSTGGVCRGWALLGEEWDRWNPDQEEDIRARWCVFHRPEASFALPDDLQIQKTTSKQPRVTGLHRNMFVATPWPISLSSNLALPSPMWIATFLGRGWLKTILSYSYGASLRMMNRYVR